MTMALVQTIEVGPSGAASVSFTSVPQGFTDLLVVGSARIAGAVVRDGVLMRFNGDSTSANYQFNWMYSVNGSLGTPGAGNISGILAFEAPGASSTANTFGNAACYIPNYTGSTQKSTSTDAVGENNAAAATIYLNAGRWNSTAAITSITILNPSSNLVEGSTFSLYGITKGSGGATVS